jgi:hypothetical protein
VDLAHLVGADATDERPLDGGRRAVAVLSLLLFAATFIPVPISM